MNSRSKIIVSIKRISRYGLAFGSYIAEIGQVAFVATAIFGLLATILEILYPGFVTNWISSGLIIKFTLVVALLSLWPNDIVSEEKSGWVEVILGLLFSVTAFLAAWHYFEPMIDDRLVISLVSGLSVGLSYYLLVFGDFYSDFKK